MLDQIRVGQLNLHHSRAATALLSKRLADGGLDIALIQEPWTRDGRILGLTVKGFNIYYDVFSDRPRACIIARSELNVLNLVDFLNRDQVAVKVRCKGIEGNTDFVIVSAYLPYEDSDPLTDMTKALVSHWGSGCKLIFGCDANAHHTLWGSSDCNRRGDVLMDHILYYNLFILNRGNEPTFVNVNRREVIDLTLCNSTCLDYITDWKVSDAITASDHRLITFSIKGLSYVKVEGRNPRRTDCDSFKQELKRGINTFSGKLNSADDLEGSVDKLQQIILNAYHNSCKVTSTSSPRNVPWWSSELSVLRKKCRKLFNRAKKTGEWTAYRESLTIYNKAIRVAKRQSWQAFCEGINDISATAKMAKILTRDKSCSLNAVRLPDGKFSSTSEGTLAELLRVHFPGSVAISNDRDNIASTHGGGRGSWNAAKLVISQDKIIWAIKSFSPYKSPGMDDIIPALLIKGCDLLAPLLCRIFRACIAYGYIPRAWRNTKVVFIPKPGKDNYFDAKSFRPISLSSFLLKTLEKLVDRYIRDIVLADRPLSSSQHAYQPGKSTNTALYELSFHLEKALSDKDIALVAFIDIEGAFDRVPFNTIIRALDSCGVNMYISRWIASLLSSRYVCASLMGTCIRVLATSGCPQGGVLSPILWCMVVDSLLVHLAKHGIPCIGYADDGAIVVRGKHGLTVADIMNSALRLVARWCTDMGLSVNPSKVSLVAFTRKRSIALGDVFFLGEKLELSEDVKFLGVYFDARLNWGRQVDYCILKAKRVFWACKNSISRTWGLSPKVVHWIYSMIICPIITYGSIVWWSRTKLNTVRNTLNSFQRMVCIALSGCMRTTPTAALESLLGLLPLYLRIEAEALSCAKRFMCMGVWRDHSRLLSWGPLISRLSDLPSLVMPSDCLSTRFAFYKPFKIHFPTRENWLKSPSWLKGNCMVWYTDGSKQNLHSGAGIFCPRDNTRLSFPLGRFATVFQAEVYAIISCCKVCLDRGYCNMRIRICSDSQAALYALARCIFTSSLVWECYNALCALSSFNKVSLYWVPGHMGIPGNELADELAKTGSNMLFCGPEPVLGLSQKTYRTSIVNLLSEENHKQWRNSFGQRQAKELNRDCPSLRHKELLKLNRNGLRKVIGLLTGHCSLKRHLCIIGISPDPTCRGCHLEEETAKHILCDCEVFSAHRFEHLGRHLLEPWELQDIPVRCLLNFASAIKLFS